MYTKYKYKENNKRFKLKEEYENHATFRKQGRMGANLAGAWLKELQHITVNGDIVVRYEQQTQEFHVSCFTTDPLPDWYTGENESKKPEGIEKKVKIVGRIIQPEVTKDGKITFEVGGGGGGLNGAWRNIGGGGGGGSKHIQKFDGKWNTEEKTANDIINDVKSTIGVKLKELLFYQKQYRAFKEILQNYRAYGHDAEIVLQDLNRLVVERDRKFLKEILKEG